RETWVCVAKRMTQVRITGGEPLLRNGVEGLVKRLTEIDGLESVDITNNCVFLGSKAQALKTAGLRGVTVSLHSLKEDRFARISGINALPRVLESISEAVRVGLHPLKINSVAIRGYNDDEVLDLVEYARKMNVAIRFIEFMPLDGLDIWDRDKMVKGQEILETVRSRYSILPGVRAEGETARIWKFPNGTGEHGLISALSESVCERADRR